MTHCFDNQGMKRNQLDLKGTQFIDWHSVTPDQLRDRHARLERELADAFGEQPLPGARIDRLVDEIAAAERALAGSSAHRFDPPEHLGSPDF
jgi:DnaJ-class molecular chaperone